MLQRPDIGTMDHMKLWVASKPENETFIWADGGKCAAGQYAQEFDTEYYANLSRVALHALKNKLGLPYEESVASHSTRVSFGEVYKQMLNEGW